MAGRSELEKMRASIAKRVFWVAAVFPRVAEYGLYLLVIFLYTDRGESFRNIGIYIPTVLLFLSMWITRRWLFDWRNPFLILIGVFCLSAVVASFFSGQLLASLDETRKTYLKVLLIFLVTVATFNSAGLFRKMLFLLSLLALFFTIMTFYDYITKAIAHDGEIIYDVVRPYSESLPFFLPFVPFTLLIAKSKVQKILWALVLCIGIAALLLTGFRGGWASMFVSLLIWAMWLLRKRMSMTLLSLLLGTVFSISVFLAVFPSSHIIKRLQEGFSTTGRYEWRWKAYVQMYNDFPLSNKIVGKGLPKKIMFDSYSEWYKQKTGNYIDEDVKRWPRNPHNNYLVLLFRQGIIGIMAYLSLILIYIKLVTNAIRKHNIFEYKAIGIAILCPFIGEYVVRALVEDMRFMPLGLLVGLASAYLNLKEDGWDNERE
jgi:hypothetical protein